MICCIITFLVDDQYLTNSTQGKKAFLASQSEGQSIVEIKDLGRAAGPTASTVTKQRVTSTGDQLAFAFLFSQDPSPGDDITCIYAESSHPN